MVNSRERGRDNKKDTLPSIYILKNRNYFLSLCHRHLKLQPLFIIMSHYGLSMSPVETPSVGWTYSPSSALDDHSVTSNSMKCDAVIFAISTPSVIAADQIDIGPKLVQNIQLLDLNTLILVVFDIIFMYRLTEKEDRVCQTTITS